MFRIFFIAGLCFFSTLLSAQDIHVGIFGGAAAYRGDLTYKIFPKKVTNGVVGITGNYELTEHIALRAGINYTIVGGADRFNKDSIYRLRNLSFETKLLEFNTLGEYYVRDLQLAHTSPYVFAGVAVYHYDPYAYFNGVKYKLKPLSTEGQGLPGYNNKNYALTNIALPLGLGFKVAVTNRLRIGLEAGYRILFTDYFDDVSKIFADYTDLFAAKGQSAIDLAFRSNEIIAGAPYPVKGYTRGNPKDKDSYYFAGLHVTFNITNGGGAGNGGRVQSGKLGCPKPRH